MAIAPATEYIQAKKEIIELIEKKKCHPILVSLLDIWTIEWIHVILESLEEEAVNPFYSPFCADCCCLDHGK